MKTPILRAVMPEMPREVFSNRLRDMGYPFMIKTVVMSGGNRPCASLGRDPREFTEITGRTAERTLYAVGQVRITPVQCLARDCGEHVGDERVSGFGNLGVEVLETDRDVADRAAYGMAQCVCHVSETHQLRAGHFVKLALVVVFCQRGHDNVGNVVDVDDWFHDIVAGHRQDPGEDRVTQIAFGIILREPRRADDGEVYPRVTHDLLAQTGMVLAPSGQQDQMLDARVLSGFAE